MSNAGPLAWRDPTGIGRNNFDFLRLVLAVMVIFSHSYDLAKVEGRPEPLLRATDQTTFGTMAVDGFFVISGFLVTHSWVRSPQVWGYVWKRLRRIYPAFVVALTVTVFVVGPFSTDDLGRPFTAFDMLKYLGGCLSLRGDVQDYAFPTNPYPNTMNGSTWSIPYEVRCYAAVVVLGLAGALKSRAWMVSIMGASLLGALLFEVFHLKFGNNLLSYVIGWPDTWARLLPCYVAGMLFYLLRIHVPFSTPAAVACLLGLIVGALLPFGLSVLVPVLGTYLLLWFAYHPSLKLTDWGGRMGDWSYGTYLYAFPIQQLLIRHVDGLRSPLLLFAAATPLSLAAGFLSWHLVEKRFVGRRVT